MSEHPFWLNIVTLLLLILVLVGACQMYRDCLADGRPAYECAHYARSGR